MCEKPYPVTYKTSKKYTPSLRSKILPKVNMINCSNKTSEIFLFANRKSRLGGGDFTRKVTEVCEKPYPVTYKTSKKYTPSLRSKILPKVNMINCSNRTSEIFLYDTLSHNFLSIFVPCSIINLVRRRHPIQ